MSRFIQGNCIQIMSGFPDKAVDFILTDPPYLVGFRDRAGRTIAGDQTDEWLQPACHEMYRVLKNDSLMVSFYGWNRADRFISAWTAAGFRIVGHFVFAKTYASKSAYVGYTHECAYVLAKGRPRLPENPLPDVQGWKYTGNRHHPTEKPVTSLQPLIESFTHPGAIILDPFAGSGSTCVAALQAVRDREEIQVPARMLEQVMKLAGSFIDREDIEGGEGFSERNYLPEVQAFEEMRKICGK